jgi:hypothetical protein
VFRGWLLKCDREFLEILWIDRDKEVRRLLEIEIEGNNVVVPEYMFYRRNPCITEVFFE